jgi:hypothetical protein
MFNRTCQACVEVCKSLRKELGEEVQAHNITPTAQLQSHHGQNHPRLALPHVQLQTHRRCSFKGAEETIPFTWFCCGATYTTWNERVRRVHCPASPTICLKERHFFQNIKVVCRTVFKAAHATQIDQSVNS